MTELEACVLALVCRDGPITAYQVRMEFERSLASSWRASTGSVYPLIKRMSANALIRMKPELGDKRGSQKLVATPAGKRRVEQWLADAPSWLGDAAEDPIRTRVHFLELLTPTKRASAIDAMQSATQSSLQEIDLYLKTLGSDDRVARLVHEGARGLLVARATWLEKVKRAYGG